MRALLTRSGAKLLTMRLRYILLLLPMQAACTSIESPSSATDLRPTIDGGRGSEFGNYPAVPAGEIVGPEGTPCQVFAWDRPLSDGRILRVRSASCAFAGRPGGLIAIELDKQIISMSRTNLRAE